MKIYVAGKITGEDREKCIYKFGYASSTLRKQGHKVINPKELLKSMESQNFDYEDFMVMCFAAIDLCDAVYMLEDWPESPGARREHEYALNKGKQVIYQSVKG
jgi:hypothetical protein